MHNLLQELNIIYLYKKNHFFLNHVYLPTSSKIIVDIKRKKFRLNLLKRIFLTVELILGLKPLIRKLYFKKISRKKMQLRIIIIKNISSTYICDFLNFLFFYVIQFLPTTSKFYRNFSYFRKDYCYTNNFFYNFNLANIFNFFSLNSPIIKYMFLKNYKFKISFYFFNKHGNTKTLFFFELLSVIKNYQASWIEKLNEETYILLSW